MGLSEASVRRSLGYAPWECGLCSATFHCADEARDHFRSPDSAHPAQPIDITEAIDVRMERKVLDAMKASSSAMNVSLPSHPSSSQSFDQSQKPFTEPPKPSEDGEGMDSDFGDETTIAMVSLDESGEDLASSDEEDLVDDEEDSIPKPSALFCSLCSVQLKTTTRESAVSHVKMKHLAAPPFACKLCHFASHKATDAQRHAAKRHLVEVNHERSWLATPVDYGEVAEAFAQSFPGLRPLDPAKSKNMVKGHLTRKRMRLRTLGSVEESYKSLHDEEPVQKQTIGIEVSDLTAKVKSGPEIPGSSVEAAEKTKDEAVAEKKADTKAGETADARPVCRLCQLSVRDVNDAKKKHIFTYHSSVAKYQCLRCDNKQWHVGNMKYHVVKKHGAKDADFRDFIRNNPTDKDELRTLLQQCF